MAKKEVTYVLSQHLNHLKTRWLAHANEAEDYKNLYEEANLFVQRAIQRLPEEHPLHPFNYNNLFSDEYAQQLASVFEEQDAEPTFDPELDETIGIDEIPVTDVIPRHLGFSEEYPGTEGEEFNISEYNKKVIEEAKNADENTVGKVLLPEPLRKDAQEKGFNPYITNDTVDDKGDNVLEKYGEDNDVTASD